MNCNGGWRPRFEEADGRIRSLRRIAGIETEVIQSAPTQRIRVLVLREGLRAPAQSIGGLTRSPGNVAKSRVALCSIGCKSGRIKRGMKPEIAHRASASKGQAERLNPAIKILVVEGVLIMPNPSDRARHFVGNERTAIDSRNGLDRIDGRSSPGIDGRGHSHRGSNRRKAETRRAADVKLTVGGIVVHVALSGVSLAPGVLMRSDVLRFGEVRRAHIQRRVQVAAFHKNPVRCAVVNVAAVVG